MVNVLSVAVVVFVSPADSVHFYYAHRDVVSLVNFCGQTETRETELHFRCRLFPLTEEADLLKAIPETIPAASVWELALLSELWGYRAAHGSMIDVIRHGGRSHSLLEAAKRIDPVDPVVLLIEGQSLLFRRGIFGGDPQQALLRFRTLQRIVSQEHEDVVTSLEADVWSRLALVRLGDSSAETLKASLERQPPRPLYVDFLRNAPGS